MKVTNNICFSSSIECLSHVQPCEIPEDEDAMFDWSRLKTFSSNYLFNALTSNVVRLRYLSRSMMERRSRRFARHIRLVAR